jgi:hypothetical protein
MNDLGQVLGASMRRRVGRVAVIAAIAVGAFTACSSTPQAPAAQAVPASFDNLLKQSSLSMRFTLGVSATQLGTLATSNGDKGISSPVANTIANGSIFLYIQDTDGKPLNSRSGVAAGNTDLDFGLKVKSATPLEIRLALRPRRSRPTRHRYRPRRSIRRQLQSWSP